MLIFYGTHVAACGIRVGLPRMQLRLSQQQTLDKKRTILLLRSVVVISTSYLILFGERTLSSESVGYILALIVSNILLTLTPREWFHKPRFSAALLLTDTAVVLIGLYLTVGCFSQDFLIIYFFTIFLTTATSSVAQIAVGAAMISGLYGYWLWLTSAHSLGAGEWLRLPFFFIVAVFYAYVTEETKQERYRRAQAERESEHLRFLLNLSGGFSQQLATEEWLKGLGGMVEAAFPRLQCRMLSEPTPAGGQWPVYLLRSHGHTYGTLQAEAKDGGGLSPDENQFCKVVAAVAADALYTAEQVNAARDGLRVKEEFLATLSHELRSPLHVILGNAEILQDILSESCDQLAKESIQRLRSNACRLLDLVEEMLCFAELRAGKGAVYPEAVDLREFVGECSVAMHERLAGRSIHFESSIGDDVPVLQTDGRKLRLILNGLLSNAAKFTEKGFVRLSVRRSSPECIEIAVQDTGIGIDAKNLRPIFQEFRQVDGSLKRRFEGLGLGLALAHELAMVLGGRVEVESELQRGSTFRVTLPINARVGAAPSEPAGALATRPNWKPAT